MKIELALGVVAVGAIVFMLAAPGKPKELDEKTEGFDIADVSPKLIRQAQVLLREEGTEDDRNALMAKMKELGL